VFRFETLVIAGLLGSPVAALWLRGDFTDADVWWRFGLCWLVAWAAVSLLSAAARPTAASATLDADDEADEDEGDSSTHDAGTADATPGGPTAPTTTP
jgi:hypothetical protein